MTARRILVVDDEPEVREIVSTILRLAGYQIGGAEEGEEALRHLAAQPFDMMITDLLMPDKDGVETIRDVRKRYPGIKIVAMSGGGHVAKESYLKMAQLFGADAVLAKPFTREELLRTVAAVLDADSSRGASAATPASP